MADFFISHLPADKIPFWDFNDPAIPSTYRDSSAASIAASGLLQLARLDPVSSAAYNQTAQDLLAALSTSPYLAEGTTSKGVLNRGAWYIPPPINSGESSTIWGDYYFLEAINRYQGKV